LRRYNTVQITGKIQSENDAVGGAVQLETNSNFVLNRLFSDTETIT
jgi:hypothetical protein